MYLHLILEAPHPDCCCTAEGSCVVTFPAQLQPEQAVPSGNPSGCLFSFQLAQGVRLARS